MEFPTIRTRPAAPLGGSARTRASVKTEVSSAHRVNAAPQAEGNMVRAVEPVSRDGLIDPDARSVLFEEAEQRRRERPRNPDAALTRMRAYGETMRTTLPEHADPEPDNHSDRAV